jgi:hypothetical protein
MSKTFQTLAILLCASAAVPASANLVVNGSFETGDFTGWDQVNDTSFTGVDCTGAFATDGDCGAFFGPTDPAGGGILQTITTVAGGVYTLTFDLQNDGPPPNAFGLFWDGGFVDLDFDVPMFPYATFTAQLTASGSSTDLGFIFYHEPSFWDLDNVNLDAAVPEPATWAMMIGGFGLVGGAARRRATQVSYA